VKPFDYQFILNQIKYWELVKELWEKSDVLPTDSLETATFKLYLRIGNVNGVVKELKALNYRIQGKSNSMVTVTTNDVSNIISKSSIDDKELEKVVKDIQKNHKNWGKRNY